VTERRDVEAALGPARVLDALKWAHAAAYSRTLADYYPETGHDQAWVGTTAYKMMLDRLDRVFSCGKYAVAEDGDDADGLDVLGAGLFPGELDAMPVLPAGSVTRSDLNQSPGWAAGSWRWLLASCPYGTARQIPWGQKSKTKRRVAAQPNPDQPQLAGADDGLPVFADVMQSAAEVAGATQPATLVLAHSINVETEVGQLLLGRPRSRESGDTWWWAMDLLELGDGGADRMLVPSPREPVVPAAAIPDAPVRLRRDSAEAEPSAGEGA
jgi:hypothetical protein